MNMKKAIASFAAVATLATGVVAVPAQAHHGRGGHAYDRGYDRGYNDSYDRYDNRGYYGDRRARCSRGTGGTIIGAVVGGLAGRKIAGRGSRTEGAIIGAGVGALAGRAIDKAGSNCRRRY
jgi:Glycine zipper 2TM domain